VEHKDGRVVLHYTPLKKLYIDSINLETGEVSKKRILEFTVHQNVELYSISKTNSKKWKPLYGTKDHGYIVFDRRDRSYKRVSLFDIDKENHFFVMISPRSSKVRLVSLDDLKIELYDQHGTAFDFTVEDNFTFAVNNGLFVFDTVSLIRVFDNKQDVWQKMSPASKTACINFQNGSSYQFVHKQDIVYGLYLLSKTPEGRKKIESIVGKPIGDEPLTKKRLAQLLSEISDITVTDKLCKLADKQIIRNPITLSLLDFMYDKNGQLMEDKFLIDDSNDYLEVMKKLNDMEEYLKENFNKRDIILSGARGDFSQVRQISMARGFVTDFRGRVVQTPVKSSYLRGLKPEETFISAKGTRKALIDTISSISKSGYMFRKLAFTACNALLNLNIDDCSYKKEPSFIKLENVDEKLARALLKRYYTDEDPKKNNVVLKQVVNPQEIVGKDIWLRSPLTCKSIQKGICRTCYPFNPSSKFIGIIAAQSISERTTQLTLRTFHTGGVAKDLKGTGKSEDVTNTLRDVIKYFDSSKVYRSVDSVFSDMLTIWRHYSELSNIQLIHFEIVTMERLYVRPKDSSNGQVTEVSWKHYLSLENKPEISSLVLYSVKQIPTKKSKTLGLLFENPVLALKNIIVEQFLENKLKQNKLTPLDGIYLFLSL